jgi:succinate dehydrogenase / fumarate reductase membrane anchor subunit
MSERSKYIRSPLSNARGLGSTHEGASHWLVERMTSLALVPLTLWFLASLLSVMNAGDITAVRTFISGPISAFLLAIFVVINFIHARMGTQVVIEDYVHSKKWKAFWLTLNYAAFSLAMLASLFAIAKIHFL